MVVNFPSYFLQKSYGNYFQNFGVSLRETNRQTKEKKKKVSSFQKHYVLDFGSRSLSQEPSDSCILYFNVTFRGK